MGGIGSTFAIATLLCFSTAGLLAQSRAETGRPPSDPAQIRTTERTQEPRIDAARDVIEGKPEAITVSATSSRKSADPIPRLPLPEGRPKNRKAKAANGRARRVG
jgi:hypothetical protein